MQDCERPVPPFVGGEKEMLLGFLEFQRATAICKLRGVSDDDALRTLGPSSLTLGGIVTHLAFVERAWFRSAMEGEDLHAAGFPDDINLYWAPPEHATVEDLIDQYHQEIARSNAIIEAHDLDDIAARPRGKRPPMQLRWIMLHMIEEVARHLGHMDLIRESIDGQVGA